MERAMKKVAIAAMLAVATQAAGAVTLTPVRTGTFSFGSSSAGTLGGSHVTYDAGSLTITYSQQPSFGFNVGSIGFSGFAIFDLAKLAGSITDGTLQADVGGRMDPPPFQGISFIFHASDIAPSAFNVSYDECAQGQPVCSAPFGGPGTGIYYSLPSGTTVAAVGVATTGPVATALNNDGLQFVQSGLGGLIVLGIGYSGYGGVTLDNLQLTLHGVSAVPLPASWVLIAPLLGTIGRRRVACA